LQKVILRDPTEEIRLHQVHHQGLEIVAPRAGIVPSIASVQFQTFRVAQWTMVRSMNLMAATMTILVQWMDNAEIATVLVEAVHPLIMEEEEEVRETITTGNIPGIPATGVTMTGADPEATTETETAAEIINAGIDPGIVREIDHVTDPEINRVIGLEIDHGTDLEIDRGTGLMRKGIDIAERALRIDLVDPDAVGARAIPVRTATLEILEMPDLQMIMGAVQKATNRTAPLIPSTKILESVAVGAVAVGEAGKAKRRSVMLAAKAVQSARAALHESNSNQCLIAKSYVDVNKFLRFHLMTASWRFPSF
jgi:hypothetical protein